MADVHANAGTGSAVGPGFDFKPSQRYPDPSVQILDPSFGKYRNYSSTVEQLGTGMRWADRACRNGVNCPSRRNCSSKVCATWCGSPMHA